MAKTIASESLQLHGGYMEDYEVLIIYHDLLRNK